MGAYEHDRTIIVHTAQHLLQHQLINFSYVNPNLPFITNPTMALDYLFNTLYPSNKPGVATVALLPLTGNTLGDFRSVADDGDGKAAGYKWLQLEGEATASWHKVYDMDWGAGDVLASFYDIAQEQFVVRRGSETRDPAGVIVTGLYAGQQIYGGTLANTNLTLFANSGDGVGARTGYVQVDDNFRPTINETFKSGNSSFRWSKVYTKDAEIGTMTISQGVAPSRTTITDSTNLIDFVGSSILTTGDYTGTNGYLTSSVKVGALLGNRLNLGAGSITDDSGAISFDNENLTTTGDVTSNSVYAISTVKVGALLGQRLLLAPGSIKDDSGAISFDNENLTTTGDITGANGYLTSSVKVGALLGNRLILGAGSITDDSGAISFDNENLSTSGGVTGGFVKGGNLKLNGNTLSSEDTDGKIILDPNGTGSIDFAAYLLPSVDSLFDIGAGSYRVKDFYIIGDIKDNTNTFTVSDLMKLKNIMYRDAGRTLPAQTGDALIFNGTEYLANIPDAEIKHENISGLYLGATIPSTNADAGHPQFVLLAGRTGGQTIQGGIAASENLYLESTAHATKGNVYFKDTILPNTNATYGGGVWGGLDIGDSTHYIKDIYSKGEAKGLRLENFTEGTKPSSSAQNPGRVLYCTDSAKAYIDTGVLLQELGSGSGGGASGLTWNNDDSGATGIVEYAQKVYLFAVGGTEYITATLKVPDSYQAGKQIQLEMFGYSLSTSNDFSFTLTSYLIKPDVSTADSVIDSGTSTLSKTNTVSKQVRKLLFDVSDATGKINSVAIAAGDLIKISITRPVDTDTGDVRLMNTSEVKYV